jgi:hypothetical protein
MIDLDSTTHRISSLEDQIFGEFVSSVEFDQVYEWWKKFQDKGVFIDLVTKQEVDSGMRKVCAHYYSGELDASEHLLRNVAMKCISERPYYATAKLLQGIVLDQMGRHQDAKEARYIGSSLLISLSEDRSNFSDNTNMFRKMVSIIIGKGGKPTDDAQSKKERPPKPKSCLRSKDFKISIAYPKFLSKGSSSSFLVNIYQSEARYKVKTKLIEYLEDEQIRRTQMNEKIRPSSLIRGQTVSINLTCPRVNFSSGPFTKTLEQPLISVTFNGSPDDNCSIGRQQVTLVISNKKTGEESDFVSFSIKVVDFAFDHISRPFLYHISSAAFGIGSLIMFSLSLLGQIDTVLGLASGTAAVAAAGYIYRNFIEQYKRTNIIHGP